MPLYDIVELVSADAAQLRRVGFIGILCAYVYEAGAFDGKAHTIEDPQKASLRMAETLHSQEADAMIPITHLDQEDDEKLVEALSDQPLPVPAILGGHEHSPMVKHVNNTKVVKAGMDALQAVIVDVVWKSPEDALPQTRVWMEPVASYHPDQAMAKRVEKHLAALKVLAPQAPAGADGEGEVEVSEEKIGEVDSDTYLEPEQLLQLKPRPKKEHWSPARTPNIHIKNELHKRAWRSSLHGRTYY
jgi:2',3'-cyclic-nucleotide 2'-phosphodiesterase (5'-nucleotidase family)